MPRSPNTEIIYNNLPEITGIRDIPLPEGLDHQYRSLVTGVLVAPGLIYGVTTSPQYSIYTLEPDDMTLNSRPLYSLKKRFLEMEDLMEYTFGCTFFVSWEHYSKAKENQKVSEAIESWKEELEVRLRAKGLKSIVEAAEKGNYNAAKLLVDKGWSTKRGRPSKAEIEGERRQQALLKKDVEADMSRILSIVSK